MTTVRRARLEAGDKTFVIADHGVAGYCRIVAPDEVASLYVLPERRRGGLGSALLAAGLNELRALGADHATLWVFTATRAARGFYAHFDLVPGTGLDEIRLRAGL